MDHLALIASGGAGINVLSSGQLPKGVNCLAIGTDEGHLLRARQRSGLPVYQSTAQEVRGWEHVRPEIASHFTRLLPAPVRDAFTRAVVVHAFGLGGATGTGIAQALNRIRAGISRPTLHLAVLPFAVERQRHERALEAASRLESDSALVMFANDVMLRAAPDKPFAEAMRIANALMLEAARGLAGLSPESIEKVARSAGRQAPVLGTHSDFTKEMLESFGAEGANTGHLVAPPKARWLPRLQEKLKEGGVAVTVHESDGIGSDHWLALVRPA